jgi:CHAD domain-containing protein
MTEDVLHQYRIAVKRARYAAEFAPKSADAAQFIAQLKRLQDAVGNWHDWLTLTSTAAKHLGDVNQSTLVAALHNVTRGKFRQAVAALAASPTIQTSLKPVPLSPGQSRPASKSPVGIERAETAA